MVVCIYDKINFTKTLTLKSTVLDHHLKKKIFMEYKKASLIFFPNIIIDNK